MTGPRGPRQGTVSDVLPAGRELDTLVRDVIFGPWDESRCRVCGWKIVPDGARGCWKDYCSMRFPDGMRPPRADEPAPYSTDIAAAWQIVERLRGESAIGWSLTITPYSVAASWTLAQTRDGQPFVGANACAETAPHAICLAALRARENRS